MEALGLGPGTRVLDVGCGPGRHSLALAARGIEVVGRRHLAALRRPRHGGTPPGQPARFERLDARALPFDAEFDAAISLCQGAFGLVGGPAAARRGPSASLDPDRTVLDGIARALRPGGVAAVSAFSAYFQVRFLEDTDAFDANRGVNHERTTVRDEQGSEAEHDLWTTCFTPRELRLLAAASGLEVDAIWSVTPGRYERAEPDLDHPEFLVVAHRPSR